MSQVNKKEIKGNNSFMDIECGFWDYIFQDAKGFYNSSTPIACFLRCIYLIPFRTTVKYRFIQYLIAKRNSKYLVKWFRYRYSVKTAKLNCYLEPETQIGPGVIFPHGFPLVIHSHAKIGNHCIIHPGVQIGTSRTKEGAPVIGDNCFLGNGCDIIGNCKIGDWCFISPGAFVCKDIPDGSVVGFGLNNIISDKGKETLKLYM